MSKTGERVVEEINRLNLNLSAKEPECKTSEGDVCGGQTPQSEKGDE